MKFYNNKKLYFSIATTSIIFIPVFSTISCSKNSYEDKIMNLMSNPNIVSLKLDVEAIKEYTGNEEIKLSDIFSINRDVIKIEYSNELKEWNNSLSDDINQKIYKINASIKNFIVPKLDKDETQINELEVIIKLSGGNISEKLITKKIDLNQYQNINKTIIKGNNNIIEISEDIPANSLLKAFKDNLKIFFRSKQITESTESLSGKFDSNVEGFNLSQKNLYYKLDTNSGGNVTFLIYTNDSEEEEITSINSNCFALKITFNLNDLNEGGTS